jgi:hypothetical protein
LKLRKKQKSLYDHLKQLNKNEGGNFLALSSQQVLEMKDEEN